MIAALLDRLRLVTEVEGFDIKTYAERVQERAILRMEMENYRAEKEAELAQLDQAFADMDFAEATEGQGQDHGENENSNEGNTS